MFKADIKPDAAEAAQAAAAGAAAGIEGSISKGKSSYTGVSWNDRNQRFEVGGWTVAQRLFHGCCVLGVLRWLHNE